MEKDVYIQFLTKRNQELEKTNLQFSTLQKNFLLMEQENESLIEKLKVDEEKSEHFHSELQSMEETIQFLEEENISLIETLKMNGNKLKKYNFIEPFKIEQEIMMEVLENENQNLEAKLKKNKEIMENLKLKVKKLRETLMEMNKKKIREMKKNAELDLLNQNLKIENSTHIQQLENYLKENQTLKYQIYDLKPQIYALKNVIQNIKLKIENLIFCLPNEKENDLIIKKIIQICETMEGTKKEKEVLRERIKIMENVKVQIKNQFQILKATENNFRIKLETKTMKSKEDFQFIGEMKRRHEDLENKLQQTIKNLTQSENISKHFLESMQNLHLQKKKEKKDLLAKIKENKEKEQNFLKIIKILEQKLKEKENNSLKMQIWNLEYEKCVKENKNLKLAELKYQNEIKYLGNEVRKCTKTLQLKKISSNNLNEKVKKVTEEKENLMKKIDTLNKQLKKNKLHENVFEEKLKKNKCALKQNLIHFTNLDYKQNKLLVDNQSQKMNLDKIQEILTRTITEFQSIFENNLDFVERKGIFEQNIFSHEKCICNYESRIQLLT
jgi:hypothetical protein